MLTFKYVYRMLLIRYVLYATIFIRRDLHNNISDYYMLPADDQLVGGYYMPSTTLFMPVSLATILIIPVAGNA